VALICAVVGLVVAMRFSVSGAGPLSITFIYATNSVPGHSGPHAAFAITNRASFPIALPFGGSSWRYKDGKRSDARQQLTGANTVPILQPHEGCLITFGGATNVPCRLEIPWFPKFALYWIEIPIPIRQKASGSRNMTVHYQRSDWLTEPRLINQEP